MEYTEYQELGNQDAELHYMMSSPEYRAHQLAKDLIALQNDIGAITAINLFARNLHQMQGTTNPAMELLARKAA